jgi:hypothetical protein
VAFVHLSVPAPVSLSPGRAAAVAALLAGAGAIHLAVAPEHAGEFLPFGVAFYAMAAAQVAAAAAFVTGVRSPALGRAAVVLSLAIAALWVISRTVGLPIGPEPWHPEAVGAEDSLCTALELGATALLTGRALPTLRAGSGRGSTPARRSSRPEPRK